MGQVMPLILAPTTMQTRSLWDNKECPGGMVGEVSNPGHKVHRRVGS